MQIYKAITIGRVTYTGVAYKALIEVGVSEDTARQYRRNSQSWQRLPDVSDARLVWIRYDTMAEKYQALLHQHYGTPDAYFAATSTPAPPKRGIYPPLPLPRGEFIPNHAPSQKLSAALQTNPADTQFFRTILNRDSKQAYTDTQCRDLTRAAAWLRLLKTALDEPSKYGFKRKTELLDAALAAIRAENIGQGLYGLKVKNTRVLDRKVAEYYTQKNNSLVSGKIGNVNAEKLDDEIKLLLRGMYRQHNRLCYTHLHAELLKRAASEPWGQQVQGITVQTVTNYLSRPDVRSLCLFGRYDRAVWRSLYDQTIKRQRPTQPHDFWSIDGTMFELYYMATVTVNGKDTKVRKRLYTYIVVDAATWAILGWTIGDSSTENQEMVFNAIRNAYYFAGCLPLQIQSDHGSANMANDMVGWLSQSVQYVTPAEVGNAKSKIVEAVWKHLNQSVLKPQAHNHSGGNVTVRTEDSRPSNDWLKANKDTLPNLPEAIAQINSSFHYWNNNALIKLKGEAAATAPVERLKKPHRAKVLGFEEQVAIFWRTRYDRKGEAQLYTYTQNGIQFQHKGETHNYRVYDTDGQQSNDFWRHNAGQKFVVKYDTDTPDMIMLYQDGKQAGIAQRLKETPMALADRKEGDAKFVQGELAKRKQFSLQIKAAYDTDTEALQTAGLLDAMGMVKSPMLIGGQYKEALNAAEEALKSGEWNETFFPTTTKQQAKGKKASNATNLTPISHFLQTEGNMGVISFDDDEDF
jgi:hypothetical protein